MYKYTFTYDWLKMWKTEIQLLSESEEVPSLSLYLESDFYHFSNFILHIMCVDVHLSHC
jgi:hypothetical protein